MIAPSSATALHCSAVPPEVAAPPLGPVPEALTRRLASRRWRVLVLLTLVVALSAMDLYLTIMYTTTIGMPEVNPLARALLRHGSLTDLILWKIGSVGLCAGILLRLRDRLSAEIGAWIAFAALVLLSWQWCAYAKIHETIAAMDPGIDYRMASAYEPSWVELGTAHRVD